MNNNDATSPEISTFTGTEEPHVFGTIQKADDQLIMVSFNDYKGYKYLDLRQWWKPKDESEYKPTKQGITIPIKHTLQTLEEVIAALTKAKEYFEEQDDKKKSSKEPENA